MMYINENAINVLGESAVMLCCVVKGLKSDVARNYLFLLSVFCSGANFTLRKASVAFFQQIKVCAGCRMNGKFRYTGYSCRNTA